MATQSFTYKGKKVMIEDQDDQIRLMIDDQTIQVIHIRDTGQYRAPQESFLVYSSPMELAKSLIDNLSSG